MTKERQKSFSLATFLVGVALGAVAMSTCDTYRYEREKTESARTTAQNPEPATQKVASAPPYFWYVNNLMDSVTFKDNFAPGMIACIVRDENEEELMKGLVEKDSASFYLPEDIRNYNSFIVYAIDRDNNRGESKELYVVDGVIVDSLPSDKKGG